MAARGSRAGEGRRPGRGRAAGTGVASSVLPWLGLAAGLLLAVLVLGALAGAGHPLHRYDVRIERRLVGFPGRQHLDVISHLLAPPITGGLLLIVAGAVALVTRRAAPLLVGTVGLALIGCVTIAAKLLFARPGPTQQPPQFGAYPSGHTTTAVAAVALGCLLLRLPALVSAAVGLLVGVVVGGSMVVVASHYASDVLGGLLLGLALTVLTVIVAVLVTPWRPAGVALATRG